MARNKVLYSLLLLVITLVFSSCSSRYGYIPRTFQLTKTKKNSTEFKGHYVSTSDESIAKSHIDEYKPSDAVASEATDKKQAPSSQKKRHSASKIHNHYTINTDTVDSDTVLSNPPQKIDKKLFKESNALFVIASAANASYLLLAEISFLSIALLIGLGLIILIYIADAVIMNLIDTRSKPVGPYKAYDPRRESVKKGFQMLMLAAGILFTLALLVFALTLIEEFAIVLAVFGAIAFYAGLLTGLTYLIMGLL